MHEKFLSKSARVKGVAFHPTRPLLLASLHTGAIQLWDYQMRSLVEKFEGEHEGPVRAVDFHPTQAMFASGGDDYKIKIWGLKEKRVLFELLGHIDYVRTVSFHPTGAQPWLLSASDDQTVRIWNWQNRTPLMSLAGHNHYVMSAQWHPRGEDLVVSASLDQTIRVWDISPLTRQESSAGVASGDRDNTNSGGVDVFNLSGGTSSVEVPVKFVLEGHERGVNWAAFHPTLPMIVSCGDDRLIKLWRYNETRCWEVDTLRGHVNNVSCVAFAPKLDLILSDSEDRTLRVWDATRRTQVHVVRRDHDRFWCLAVHPEHQNIAAVGHDSGLLVYKLSRERLPMSQLVAGASNLVFTVKDKNLRAVDVTSLADKVIHTVRRSSALGQGYRCASFSPADRALVLSSAVADCLASPALSSSGSSLSAASSSSASNSEAATFEVLLMSPGVDAASSVATVQEAFRGTGCDAVFIARNRFAVIDPSTREIILRSVSDPSSAKPLQGIAGLPPASRLFSADPAHHTGCLLVRHHASQSAPASTAAADGAASAAAGSNAAMEKFSMVDVAGRRILSEITLPLVSTGPSSSAAAAAQSTSLAGVKYVVWSSDGSHVALLSRRAVTLCKFTLSTQKLAIVATAQEPTLHVKSAVFAPSNVLLFATTAQIKYLLPIGGSGIVCTLQKSPMYMVAFAGQSLVFFSREGKPERLPLDLSEISFKLALHSGRFDEVARTLRSSKLLQNVLAQHGRSLVSYLTSRGYYELALRLLPADDAASRFRLALRCGDLQSALSAATALSSNSGVWKELAQCALQQNGNVEICETAMQKAKDFDGLGFLYSLTGQTDKLRKLLRLQREIRGDLSASMHVALMAGDYSAVASVLEAAHQPAMAELCRRTYSRAAVADGIGDAADAGRVLLMPPTPILRNAGSWPLLNVAGGGSGTVGLAASSDNVSAAATAVARAAEGEMGRLDAHAAIAEEGWSVDDSSLALPTEEGGNGLAGLGADGGLLHQPGMTGADQEEGWGVEEIDVPETGLPGAGKGVVGSSAAAAAAGTSFRPPQVGVSIPDRWMKTSPQSAFVLAAAGNVEGCLELLRKTRSVVHAPPALTALLELAFSGVRVSLRGVSGVCVPMYLSATGERPLGRLFSAGRLQEAQRMAMGHTTAGKIAEAMTAFQYVICQTLLTADDSLSETDGEEMIESAREYLVALTCELARRESTDPKRILELAAYFTNCKLSQPAHAVLGLRQAMTLAYKYKNYGLAASFGRRLLEKIPKPEVAEQARKVISYAETTNATNALEIDYSERNPFVVCARTLKPIYRGTVAVTRCAVCGASYGSSSTGRSNHSGNGSPAGGPCVLCQLGHVAAST